jgi:hypothetical protein
VYEALITAGVGTLLFGHFTKVLQGHARLTKRDGESVGAAFERVLTAPTPEGAALR